MMEWRILFLAAAALAAAALLFFASGPQARTDSGEWKYFIGRADGVNFGGEPAVFAQVEVAGQPEDAHAAIEASGGPFWSKILWWNGSSAGAMQAIKMREGMAGKLPQGPWKYFDGDGTDGSRGNGNYFVVPSGAWPEALLSEIENGQSPREGEVIVYFGVMDGSAIEQDGKVVKAQAWPKIFARNDGKIGIAQDAYKIGVGPGREIWIVPHAPDGISDIGAVAGGLAQAVESGPKMKMRVVEKPLVRGKNGLVVGAYENTSYARVKIRQGAETMRIADFGPLKMPQGAISGPEEAAPGGSAAFQVSLEPNLPQEEKLEFNARLQDDGGTVLNSTRIGEGTTKERWVGAFSLSGWKEPGDYIIRVEDQYGRVWGKVLLHVPKIEVKMLPSFGSEKRFLLLKDGMAVDESQIEVWKEGSDEKKMAAPINGVVAVSSHWDAHENVLRFRIGAVGAEYVFDGEGGAVSVYLKYGVPGLMLAALLYFALKPRQKPVYKLRVDALAQTGEAKVKMKWGEFASVFKSCAARLGTGKAALTLHEIQSELLGRGGAGQGLAVPEENLAHVLTHLVKNGKVRQWDGYFALAEWASDEQVRLWALGRMLSDKLIWSGVAAKKIGENVWREEGGLAREWMVHWEKATPLKGIRGMRMLVFADENEKGAFEKKMHKVKTDGSKIYLAVHEGKLRLELIETLQI